VRTGDPRFTKAAAATEVRAYDGCVRGWGTLAGWLIAAGCSTARMEVSGSPPAASELGLAVRDPVLRPPLARALDRCGVPVVEPLATRHVLHATITRRDLDGKWREPETTWVRGGDNAGLWIEFGRDVAYPPPDDFGGAPERTPATLTITIEDRWARRVVWRAAYADPKAPKTGHPDWERWLDDAAAALVGHMRR